MKFFVYGFIIFWCVQVFTCIWEGYRPVLGKRPWAWCYFCCLLNFSIDWKGINVCRTCFSTISIPLEFHEKNSADCATHISTWFSMFWNVVKHFLSCLIYCLLHVVHLLATCFKMYIYWLTGELSKYQNSL